jgi:hypothetical protein
LALEPGDGYSLSKPSRLEGISKPKAICLSEDPYRQPSGRLGMEVTDLSPSKLKNIEKPCHSDVLPKTGVILEIASGSGEHVVHFARNLPSLVFQPSDPDQDALLSVAAWQRPGASRMCARPGDAQGGCVHSPLKTIS